jgi:hypothetical protein
MIVARLLRALKTKPSGASCFFDAPKGKRTDMLQSVKESVHRMTSHLQLISSYLEMEDYINALSKTKETMKEMHALSVSLAGLASMRMTVPKDGAVVVPHGSTVVSYEDVNVDVGRNEVRSVDKDEIRAGYGNENPKTK